MSRKKVRRKTHSIARDLKFTIPGGSLPIEIKLIALFIATGGLGLISGIFGDIVRPTGVHLPTYLTRLVVGTVMIVVAYGIVTRKRWSVWLYCLVVAVGLYVNFTAAIIPLAVAVYLIFRHKLFHN